MKGGVRVKYYYESRSDKQNYHYVKHKNDPSVAPHFHSAFEVVMVRRGGMLAVINGEETKILAGEGCFVDSFSLHSYSALELDTEVYVFVGNSPDFDAVFSEIGGVPPVRFRFNNFSLLDTVVAYYKETVDEEIKGLVFRGAFTLILSMIANENKVLTERRTDKSAEFCAVLRYISEHFTEPLTLRSISAHFGYTPQYFSKIFHRYMKTNLTKYVNVARVNYAKKLFDSNSDKSVVEVAFECGFSSVPTFYRAYKKVFGRLPRD